MRFESLEIENFGSYYGKHELTLGRQGLVLVVGENLDDPRASSNGSGKSMLFDALDWCLFGKNPRGDAVDAVVNGEASECRVLCRLAGDGGVPIVVERRRGRESRVSLAVDGVPREAMSADETQQQIEQVLGLDREVFHSAVLFSQLDREHYVDQTDSGRMEILSRILQLDPIDVFLEKTKAEVQRLDQAERELEQRLAQARGQLAELSVDVFTARIDAWEADRTLRADRLAEQLRVAQAGYQAPPDRAALVQALSEAELSLGYLQAPVEQPPVKETLQARDAVQLATAEIARLEVEVVKFRRLGAGVCSACGQTITAEHTHRELERVGRELDAARIAQRKAQEVYLLWDAREQRARVAYTVGLEQYKRELQRLNGVVAIAKANVANVDAMIKSAQIQSQRQAELQQYWQSVLREANPYKAEQQAFMERRERQERMVKGLDAQLGSKHALRRYMEFWVKAFGPRGLKSYILDQRVQELTDAVNSWLQPMTGGAFWVRFESQKQLKSGAAKNAPVLRVFHADAGGQVVERAFKSWSAGEKQRISFAVDFGLSRFIARRAKHSYDVLILDEVFRHLDTAGKEAVVEILQKMAQEKSSVFVVEHDAEFQGAFERRVVVQKLKRRSMIKEVPHGNTIAKEQAAGSSVLPGDANRNRAVRREPVRRPVV